jgi:hypothetical protein
MRSIASAMSSSSGWTSCGSTGSAFAGEPSSTPASGLTYQLSSTPANSGQRDASTPSGGANVKMLRRRGTRPIGSTPASPATRSHHAPAAFTTTGAS